eukprot:gene9931-7801_t
MKSLRAVLGCHAHRLLPLHASQPGSDSREGGCEVHNKVPAPSAPLQQEMDEWHGASHKEHLIATHTTELHSVYEALWDDRNTTGNTIFGGQLLRLGYEHALEVAETFVGDTQLDLVNMSEAFVGDSQLDLANMSEVQFLNPVPVGYSLHLWGRVAFVQDNFIYVHVKASRSEAAQDGSKALAGSDPSGALAVPQPSETAPQEHSHPSSSFKPHRPRRGHHRSDPHPHLVKLSTNGFWFTFCLPTGERGRGGADRRREGETDRTDGAERTDKGDMRGATNAFGIGAKLYVSIATLVSYVTCRLQRLVSEPNYMSQ